MHVSIEDFVKVMHLPSGRATYATRLISEAAAAKEPEIAARADKAHKSAGACRDLELRYQRRDSKPIYGEDATEADALLDRGWSNFADIVLRTATLLGPETAKGAAAQRIHEGAFLQGVAAITRKTFVEEYELSRGLVERLTKGDLKDEVKTLGFGDHVDRMAVLVEDLGKELVAAKQPDTPTWDEVRAARAELQGELVSLVALICGTFPSDSAKDAKKRDKLLGPIAEQQERLSARYRARLGSVDIDPETGKEQPSAPAAGDDPQA